MSKQLSIGWIIPVTVLILSLQCYVPDKRFKKIPKIERIASSASQEWLYAKDPGRVDISRSTIDFSQYFADESYFWQTKSLGQSGGRVRDLLQVEVDSLTYLFAASASGGLFRSISPNIKNYLWKKTTLNASFISAICFDQKSGYLYVGTGEGYFEHKSFPGTGVYRSSDLGDTWTQLQSTNHINYVQDIAISDGKLLVSTVAHGLIESIDNGLTFSNILDKAAIGHHNTVNDIAIVDNQRLVVSTGIQNEGSLFLSTNAASSFQQSFLNANTRLKRIELANNETQSNILYAVAQEYDSGQATTLKKSTNAGKTWSTKQLPIRENDRDFSGGQSWYNLAMAVHPTNANWLLLGGIDLHLSKDSGNTWTKITDRDGNQGLPYMHADQHIITFVNNEDVLVGNDGGVYLIEDVFTNQLIVTPLNNDLNVGQCYAGVYDAVNDQFIVGSQDNGTMSVLNNSEVSPTELVGGDGGIVHIDSNNPELIIASYIKNNYFISRDGGENFYYRDLSNNGLFTNPSVYDENRNVLYAAEASGKILRWNNPLDLGKHVDIVNIPNAQHQVTALSLSDHKADRLFFGNASGQLLYLDFAFVGLNRVAYELAQFPEGGTIKTIKEDPLDDGTLYVVLSNYGIENIYSTIDFGKHWQSHDGNLPNMPIRDLMLREDGFVIATEHGIWKTTELLGQETIWKPILSPFKDVKVTQLLPTDDPNEIAALTFGNGIFIGANQVQFDAFVDVDTIMLSEVIQTSANCIQNYQRYPFVLKTIGCNDTLKVAGSLSHQTTTSFDIELEQLEWITADNNLEIAVKVFDDANLEGEEHAIIHLQCQCGQQKENIEVKVQISDNDKPMQLGEGSSVHMIGEFDEESDQYPFRAYYEDAKSLYKISARELLSMGMNVGHIQSIELYILNKKSDIPLSNLSIGLYSGERQNTSTFGTVTNVYSSDYTTVEGWNTFTLDQPYFWNGIDDLWVQICFNNSKWSNSDKIACHLTTDDSVYFSYADSSIGCAIEQVMRTSNKRPTTRFSMGSSNESASEIKGKYFSNIQPNSNLMHRDAFGKIVAELENNSSLESFCHTLEVLEEEDLVHELDVFAWTFNTKLVDVAPQENLDMDYTLFYNSTEFDHIDKSKPLYVVHLVGDSVVLEQEFLISDFESKNGDLLEYSFSTSKRLRVLFIQKSTLDYRNKEEVAYAITTEDFALSPNPFKNAFRIEYELPESITITKITMINPGGQEVPIIVEDGIGVKNIFPDNGIPPSWYFVKVDLSNQEYNMLKVVKH